MSTATLKITDGTDEVSLLRGTDGFYLNGWIPRTPQLKGGGTWQSSPLSDGRRLVSRRFDNVQEVFDLKIEGVDQDSVIEATQKLRRLLEKAADYWTTDWQNEPVWIEAQATCETNARYALIYSASTPVDDNPFEQPFLQPEKAAVLDDWQLIIERGHWLADEPGTGTCVQIGGTMDSAYPYYLEFNGASSEVNCGSNAAIDDLHDAAFTVEAWIRFDDWGEGGSGMIFDKTGSAAQGWRFRVVNGSGLGATIYCASTNGFSFSGTDDLDTDDEWHHVAMTWDDATYNYPRLWIDGVEPDYFSTQTRNGAIVSDAANDLYIGNRSDGTMCFDGDIGWARISDTIRYNATFTPPARCDLPDIDANTVGQWIKEGEGTAIDNQEGTAALDGTAANVSWGGDCATEFGRSATCDNEVYVANKQNMAQLTHIFVDDGGAWGGNLIGAGLPFNLLPAVPAVNDAVYFGVDTAALDSGPFCSLVFDIETAIDDVTTVAWEYWNGAWVALTEQDNTNADGAMTGVAFDTTGVNSVHWAHPSDWTTRDISNDGGPAITGYWIRARVAAIGGAPTAPAQQNRDVYTITWGHIDVGAAQVTGDITALTHFEVFNTSSGSFVASFDQMVGGIRSVSRGSNFTAYLNAADEQNPTGVTVTAYGTASIANYVRAPAGRAVRYNPAGVEAIGASSIRFALGEAISAEYFGDYRAFLRVNQSGGNPEDFSVRFQNYIQNTTIGYTFPTATGERVYVLDALLGAYYEALDLGRLSLPGTSRNVTTENILIDVELANSNASPGDLYIYDLFLLPVDEWAFHCFVSFDNAQNAQVGRLCHLDVTSLDGRDKVSASYQTNADDYIFALPPTVTNGPAILQANASQRLWLMSSRFNATVETPISEPHVAARVTIDSNNRYLSMRGSR